VNLQEARTILLYYRPGTADADDPQVAEALALAKTNPELGLWLEAQGVGQAALRAKFRQVTPPEGLREQIVSEYGASRRGLALRRALGLAVTVALLLLGLLAVLWPLRQPAATPANALADLQNSLVRTALSPYAMDLPTNNLASIRAYLAQRQAPADFTLPAPLRHTALSGCAVRVWQGARISLICFRTGKPLPPGAASDLWLFVVDRAAITNAPPATAPQFAKINRLMTATWTESEQLYFLGMVGPEAELESFL